MLVVVLNRAITKRSALKVKLCSEFSHMIEKSDSDMWTLESEIQLFHAILNHKPVGADRHFQMIYVCNLINSFLNEPVSADAVWKKLSSLYNMDELHDSEVNPFQAKMKEFSLPEEYDSLKSLKYPRVASLSRISSTRSPRTDASIQKRTRKSLRSIDSSVTSNNSVVSCSSNSPVSTTVGPTTSREKRR
ncbi:unnamed protein product [Heterobilharzia americana]|nr:unnamed protein product [Heterobilharzia americana]CAH8441325.1 unnamed protein product [Heterobilharzia americana]